MSFINNYIFLSHKLTGKTPGYGGQVGFENKQTLSMTKGDSCNQSFWSLTNHIGTHIDSPYHFDNSGKKIDDFEAPFWIFESPYLAILDAKGGEIIEVDTWCEGIPKDSDLLIIKTGFEKKRQSEDYWKHNPGLSPELGIWLRKERPNLRAIGFDFISITSYDHRALGKIAHKSFLGAEAVGHPILAIEDMSLFALTTTPKKVIVSPLIVEGADGSPVTIFAELER